MNSLFLRDLCATLVLSFGHFLWIGTLIAIVAAVAVRRSRTAEARYRVWLAALVAMAVSPFVTLAVLQSLPTAAPVVVETPSLAFGMTSPMQRPETDENLAARESLANSLSSVDEPHPADRLKRDAMLPGEADAATKELTRLLPAPRESVRWREYAPLVTSLYLIGVAVMGLRLSLGLWGGRRLRRRATPITDVSLLAALHRQATALGMRFVPALAYCERVTVPTVLGILKPMILLPVSLASGLAPDQIESVLAHELAHLRRYDHLVNLMQCVIESVLFFHPAVWWVSRRIRDEREHCCDDLVIACGAVPLDYAASLLRVAELSREAEQQRGPTHRRSFTAASLFATGDRPSTLRQRIARLLDVPVESRVRLRHPWTACGLLAASLSIAWFTAAAQRPIAAQPEETDQGEAAAQADESDVKPDRKLNDDDSAAASEFNHGVTEDQKRNLIELRDRVRKIVPKGWQVELRFGSISMDRPGRKQDAHWVRWPEAMLYFNNEDTTSEMPPIAGGTQNVSLGLCKLGYATLTIPQPMLDEWPESRTQLQAVLPEADDAARQVVQPLKSWPLVVGTLRYEDGSPVKGALVGPVGRAKVPLGDDGRYRVRIDPSWGRFFVSLKDVRDWPSSNSPPRDPAYLREVLDIRVIEDGPSVVRRDITLNRTQLRTVKLWWNGPTTKGRLRLYSNPPKDWLTEAAVPQNERPAGDKQVAVPGKRQLLVISRTLDVMLEHGKQFVINDVPPGGGHVGITLAETLQPLAWPLTGGEEDKQLVYDPADTGSVDVKVLGEDGAPLKQQAILNVMRLLPNMGFGVFNSAAGDQCERHRPVFDAKTQTHRISHLQPGRYQANVTLESLFGAPVLFDVFKDEAASVVLSISQTPVAALPEEKPKPEKYSAKLPNGVEVELAGIAHANVATDDASKRRKDDAWWSADGVKLRAPPFMQNILTVAKGVAHEYEFAIRLKSPNPAEPVRNLITSSRVSSVPNAPGGSVSSQGPASLEDGGTAVWKMVHVANMLENKPVAINVFVSDEPLVTAGFVDLDGETRPQQPPDAKIDSLRNLIQIVRVEKLENETILRCKLSPDIAERMEFQFVAIGKRGEAHDSSEPRGSDSGVFKLAAADIKHFEIRLRPMTHKVTFENVSLVPGQMTNVKVSVESIPAEKPSAVRGSPDPAQAPTEGLPKTKDDPEQPTTTHEGVIDAVADKAIVFEDGRVITTDAATKYARLTDKGEEPAERKELKAGVRVNYELTPGKGATKVVILPAKQDGEQPNDATQGEAKGNRQDEARAMPKEVFARRVSLDVKGMPLREALAAVARAARVPLRLDEPALAQTKLDLNAPVSVMITDEPLSDALSRLIDWNEYQGVYRELRGGALFLTTFGATKERTERVLPDWLKTRYIHATLDDDNQVVSMVTVGEAMTDELLARLKSLPKLRELEIINTTSITAAGLAHLAELTQLEKLSLRSVNETGEGLADVALKHVVGLKSLRELRLSEAGTTDAGIRLLETMPQLTHLDLYQEGRLTDAAIASIARLKRLKYLSLTSYVGTERLGWMRFSPEALRQLYVLQDLEVLALPGLTAPADFFLAFPRLTLLDLRGEFVDDAAAERIAQCRALRSLSLTDTRITDEGWKRIATLPELRQLCLHRERITDAGIGHLQGLTKLDHIELRTTVTDVAIGHLAEIKSLTRLDLWGGGMTVVGLQQLKQLPNLRTLSLNNFRDPAGYSSLKELTQLRELVFEMATINQQEFNDLETALPKTRILAGTGGGFLRSIRRPNGF